MLPNNPFADQQVPADYGPYAVAHFVLADRNQPKQSARTQFPLDSALPALDEDVFACQVQLVQFLFPVDSTARSNNEVYLLADRESLLSHELLFLRDHS